MMILNEKSRITMNRRRVLSDAKKLCLELAQNYQTPEAASIHLPGATAKKALMMAVKNFEKSGKAMPHDVIVSTHLAQVLSGGATDITKTITEQEILNLELEEFMKLVRTTPTLDRIEHMLETGKPLRN
jgi:3-hydroxyacyl-CoA dehydrogenase